MNLCRQRTLVSIGTHDMDTVSAPFTYDAQPPEDIVFAPLNSSEVVSGVQLFANLEKDLKLSKFLHIIRDFPRYPVIRDSQGRVMSLPPIINSDHSKISLSTRNVFIEVTATDANKAHVVLSTIVAMFSQYCDEPFSYEQVDSVLPDGSRTTSPDMSTRRVCAEVPYVQNLSGLKLEAHQMQAILGKMQLSCSVSADASQLHVDVPVTRSDVSDFCQCGFCEAAPDTLPPPFFPVSGVACLRRR
jgi:phenylalanyl-tRNA synthetase beta chain